MPTPKPSPDRSRRRQGRCHRRGRGQPPVAGADRRRSRRPRPARRRRHGRAGARMPGRPGRDAARRLSASLVASAIVLVVAIGARGPPTAAAPTPAVIAVRRLRAIPTWQITLGLALLALGFLIAAQLAVGGPARPLHDPGADAARRDRHRAAGTAGRAQDADPRPAGADPGGRGPGRGLGRPRPRAQRRARAGPDRGGPDPADGYRDRPPARGLEGSRSRPRQPADYLVGSRDIRTVVEELWLAGAEAIAINGERITPTTAIIDIGASLLVNSAYLRRRTRSPRSARPTCTTG